MPTPHNPPLIVRRTLIKLGQDITDARKRRKLSAQVVAERAFTTRKTLARIESGDHRVGMGIYASVLNALGMVESLGNAADISHDEVGRALAHRSRVPKD